jgi:nucleoside-diphosphate-sugar epimerase
VVAMQALLDGWRTGPFVFVSSLDVYGLVGSAPVTEEDPLSETYGDYGRGKVICEGLLAARAAAHGRSDFASLRAPHILGPHPKMQRRFIDPVRAGGPIVLPGADAREGSQYRDAWIDVRDLAWVIAESLARPAGGPLNVLAGHFVWRDFYAALIQLTGSSSQIVYKSRAAFSDAEWQEKQSLAQTWYFDNSKLRRQLDFIPRYTLQQTLADASSRS